MIYVIMNIIESAARSATRRSTWALFSCRIMASVNFGSCLQQVVHGRWCDYWRCWFVEASVRLVADSRSCTWLFLDGLPWCSAQSNLMESLKRIKRNLLYARSAIAGRHFYLKLCAETLARIDWLSLKILNLPLRASYHSPRGTFHALSMEAISSEVRLHDS